MPTLRVIREKLNANKKYFEEKYHVSNMYIFGSYARKEQSKDSDIDIMVEFHQPIGLQFVILAQELETLLGKRVDLVSKKGVKKKYFDRLKSDLINV